MGHTRPHFDKMQEETVQPQSQSNETPLEQQLAEAIVDAVRRFDPSLKFFGLAGSGMIDAARRAGLTPVEEVFADRGYMPDGSLVPAYAGIRPKIVPPSIATQDFRIAGPQDHGIPGLVQLFGIESPGLTSALALAEHVRAMV